MKKAAQHVFFDLAQPHPFIKDTLHLYTEQNSIKMKKKGCPRVGCSVFTARIKH